MLFDDKKLAPEAVEELLQCSIQSVAPYTLMLAPVYVFMKLNHKFVSVKAPLDFFLPEELERLKKYETFYTPKFVKQSVRYQTAARLVKNILTVQLTRNPLAHLTPFEVSNEILKVMGPLWGKELSVEPFFMAVFAHEFCKPLKEETIIWARETAVVKHDHGLLLSGAFVFLAVQLGWFDYEALNHLRDEIYERTVQGEEWYQPQNVQETIISALDHLMVDSRTVDAEKLKEMNQEWSQALLARLERVRKELSRYAEMSPSIYGPEGFAA